MSLSRAFTTRLNRSDLPGAGLLGRAMSVRSPSKPKTTRPQISGPVNLISSTNCLSFDAPNIAGTAPIHHVREMSSGAASDTSSRSSLQHSDASSTGHRDYSTDASSLSSVPSSPEPNHLSCYFKPSVYTDVPSRSNSVRSGRVSPDFDAPVVPQRAASHSKRAHMLVSRQRSVSRVRAPPSTAQELTQEPAELHAEQTHPLTQLSEAEELGAVARSAEVDAEEEFLQSHGLAQFSAMDYMTEIQDMLAVVFEEEPAQAGWI